MTQPKWGNTHAEKNKETQLNSNLSSNQELPLLLSRPHLPAANSIQAQPPQSGADQRDVTLNVFIYSHSPLKHEDSCFKLILCQGTNCHGKAPFSPPLLNASRYGIISMLTGIISGFQPGKRWIIMPIPIRAPSDGTLKHSTH